MHVKVDINQPTLAPIDVKFVVAEGLQEKTEAKRRPYVKLIRRWLDNLAYDLHLSLAAVGDNQVG